MRFLLDAILEPHRFADVVALYVATGEGRLIIERGSLTLDRLTGRVTFNWRRGPGAAWDRMTRAVELIVGVELGSWPAGGAA